MILSICLCFGIIVPTVNADEVNGLDEKTIEVLYMAGIVDKTSFSNTELEKKVSRIEFVRYAAKLNKMADIKFDENYYADVADGTFQSLLTGFVKSNYISVPEDRMFDPNRIITKNEALKIAISILGYGNLAAFDGGYPLGYNKIAKKLNIDVNEMPEEMNEKSVFYLLAQVLEAPLCIPSVVTDYGIEYSKGSGETLLSEYHNIYKREGCLLSVGKVSLDGSAKDKDKIVVNKDAYFIDENEDITRLEMMLGDTVWVYYSENGDTDGNALYICEKNSTGNTKLVVDIKDFGGVSDEYVLTYYKGDKEKTCRLERNLELIYNGGTIKENQVEVMNKVKDTDNGYIMLLDIDEKAGYEYAIIKHYKDFYVSHMDAENMILYNGIDDSNVDLNDFDMLRLYNVEGQAVTFATVGLESVLSVARSIDDTMFEAIIEKNTINGTIAKINKKGKIVYVEINGTEYELAKQFANNQNVQVNLGGTFYMNKFGQIVYADFNAESAAYIYAFLLKGVIDESGMDDTLKIKYIDRDGNITVSDAADKVLVDGKKYDTCRKVLVAIPNSSVTKLEPQIARIGFDSKGCISKIDTKNSLDINTSDDMILTTVLDGTYIGYSNGGKSIGVNVFIDKNTTVFCLPELENLRNGNYEDSELSIMRYDDIVLYTFLDGATEAYRTKKDSAVEEALVCYGLKSGRNYNKNCSIVVYSDIVRVIDVSGIERTAIIGYVNGIEKTLIIQDSYVNTVKAMNLAEGDAFFYGYDNLGEINEIVLAYDASQGGVPYEQTGSTWNSISSYTNRGNNFNCEFMYVGYKDNNRVKGLLDLNKDYYNSDAATTIFSTLTIVDTSARDGHRIYAGTFDDIKSASAVGNENCDILLIMYAGWGNRDIVVYRQ